MGRRVDQSKGIFCLEACAWFGGLKDRTSIEPVLRALETYYKAPVLHHDVGTRAEFEFYLKKWKQPQFANYPILYLGFHGTPRSIEVGEGEDKAIELTDLAERLETSCNGRIVHFGACRTLAAPDEALDAFLDRTGAVAVCGFRATVDWIESTGTRSAATWLPPRGLIHTAWHGEGQAADLRKSPCLREAAPSSACTSRARSHGKRRRAPRVHGDGSPAGL